MRGSLSLAALVLMIFSTVASADMVSNPRYTAWSKFKVGTSQTSTGDMTVQDHKMDIEVVTKLTEITDDHVTIESTTNMTIMGQKHEGKPVPENIPATYDDKDEKAKVTKGGIEPIDAMGKKIDCQAWTVTVTETDGATADIKAWTNADIPGAVKMVMHAKSDKGEMTRTVTVSSVDIK